MSTIPKHLFQKTLNLLALRIPAAITKQAQRQLNPHLLHLARIRNIEPDTTDPSKRLVLLSQSIRTRGIITFSLLFFISSYFHISL